MNTGVKIGQIQWLLFFAALCDDKLWPVWFISLLLSNKE